MMSSKKWRPTIDISYTASSKSKVFNHGSQLNDDFIIMWCDTTISNNNLDDQRTLNVLRHVSKDVVTYTDERGCLEYIDKVQERNKVILIVSGALGENFVPKIHQRTEIYVIYVFCGRKQKHEYWAKKYKKIKGVFDTIEELRTNLEGERDAFKIEQMINQLPKILLSIQKFQESPNINNPKYADHYQSKIDLKNPVMSTNLALSKAVSPVRKGEDEINDNIHCSNTVVPYIPYKQLMEFADTGIWPCVCMINETRNSLFTHLHSAIERVQYFSSIESFLEHYNSHQTDPHLIVLSNPVDFQQISQLNQNRIRRLYIYCSNDLLNEYDTWIARCSQKLSVLQHFDTLIRLILWDLSACIVDIANYYASENKQQLALTRYYYAYRLHYMIEGKLNHRTEILDFCQSIESNN